MSRCAVGWVMELLLFTDLCNIADLAFRLSFLFQTWLLSARVAAMLSVAVCWRVCWWLGLCWVEE